MKKVTVHVLAEDFKDNSYLNHATDMYGCPLQRAYIRAGLIEGNKLYIRLPFHDELIDVKVQNMFNGSIPIIDFSFTVEVKEEEICQ